MGNERDASLIIITAIILTTAGIALRLWIDSRAVVQRPVHAAQIDSIYEIFVGPDSSSLLNTTRRVSELLDSLCIQTSGQRCNHSHQSD